MSTETPEMEATQKETLDQLTDEQKNALLTISKMASGAEIARREALTKNDPHLSALISQEPSPESKCGCGCDTYVGGYFCISACGCGCNVPVTISSNLAVVSNTPPANEGTNVTFYGVVHGNTPQPFDFSNVYLTGVLDVQSIVGIQVDLRLLISPTTMTLYLYEGSRLLGSLVATYKHDFGGVNYDGYGTGSFALK